MSDDEGPRDLPFIGIRDAWTPGSGAERTDLSFYVIGYSFEYDLNAKGIRRLGELSLEPWTRYLTSLSNSEASTTPLRRVLLCGKRSSGLSTFFRCLVNRTLEGRGSANASREEPLSIRVLDLDTSTPEFAPPGMISLVHLQSHLFGPSFTHLLGVNGRPSRILKMHFLGEVDATEVSEWHVDRIVDLLDVEKRFQTHSAKVCTIIIAPKWLSDIDTTLASKLWAKLAPTSIFCLDNSATSTHLRPWRALAESSQCRIEQFPAQVFEKISAVKEHDQQMQSYFHSVHTGGDRLFWDARPILARSGREISLDYAGAQTGVCAIVLLGGHVALEDTCDALEGSVVAIVAVRLEENEGFTSERQDEARDSSDGYMLSGTGG